MSVSALQNAIYVTFIIGIKEPNKRIKISFPLPRCCELYRDRAPYDGGDGRRGEGGGERDGPGDKGNAARLRLRAHVHAHP